MSEQLELFPHLKKEDVNIKAISETEAKNETAKILEELLAQGFVNIKNGEYSKDHLESLISKLKE